MASRVLALVRAHLCAWSVSGSLVATAASHALLVGVLCGVLRGEVGPFPYALFAFALTALLLTLPWFGELGFPLRGSEARDWLESLPAKGVEHRLARLVVTGAMLVALLGPPLVVATLLAPGLETSQRIAFVLLGLGHAALCIGLLAALEVATRGRAEALWVTLQTALGALAIGGVLFSVPLVAGLGEATAEQVAAPWRFVPTVAFAARLEAALPLGAALAPLGAGALVLTAVALVPPRRDTGDTVAAGPLDRLLAPLAELAQRSWVRADERGPFRLVFDALPREREVRLRTYPLLGVPLAFLWVALTRPPGPEKDGLLALLLFTPGFYLPVLASQVCASASANARWLLETAPVPRSAIENGALKALAVRYLLPLELALGLLAWQQSGPLFALGLTPPATLVSLLALRGLYRRTVVDLPLSRPPERVGAQVDLGGPLMGVGLGLALVAIVAERTLTSLPVALGAVLALLLCERLADHHWRASDVSSGATST